MKPDRPQTLYADLAAPRAGPGAICPVDRLSTRRRNRMCLRVIFVGLLNLLVYTLVYAAVGGDAHNGERRTLTQPDGSTRSAFFVRGHFIRNPDGMEREVARSVWIYSYVHSISVWMTTAGMVISMLVLARPHILATMRDGWISGQTFVVAFGTIVILATLAAVILFTWDFIAQLAG